MFERFFSAILHTPRSTGEKIRLIRKRKKIASKDLAAKCKITDAALRHYEDGIRQVKEDRLQEIADHLEVNVSALYDRKLSTVTDVMHTLFEIEEKGWIQPEKYTLPESDTQTPYGVRSINEILNEALEQWFKYRYLWVRGQISDDDYQNWKDSFPSSFQPEESSTPKQNWDLHDAREDPLELLFRLRALYMSRADLIEGALDEGNIRLANSHFKEWDRSIKNYLDDEIRRLMQEPRFGRSTLEPCKSDEQTNEKK